MMTTIHLSSPIDTPHGRISKIEMREPRFADYMALGSPVVWVTLPSGAGYEQETSELTQLWVERLCDIDPNILSGLSLRDTLALRDAVMRFFREARAPEKEDQKPSSGSPAPSSSGSGGPTGPSKI